MMDTWPELSIAVGSFQLSKAVDEHSGVKNTILFEHVLLNEGAVLSEKDKNT